MFTSWTLFDQNKYQFSTLSTRGFAKLCQCWHNYADRTDTAWFSRFLWHPARKRSGSILTTPEPARGLPQRSLSSQSNGFAGPMHCRFGRYGSYAIDHWFPSVAPGRGVADARWPSLVALASSWPRLQSCSRWPRASASQSRRHLRMLTTTLSEWHGTLVLDWWLPAPGPSEDTRPPSRDHSTTPALYRGSAYTRRPKPAALALWNLSLRFNRHFPGEPGLAGVYWSKGWWRW